MCIRDSSIGVKEEGGIINQTAQEIDITCLPGDIPNFIEVDIAELSIGDTILANQINLDEALTMASPEDMLIVSVTLPMKEVEPEIDEELEEGEESTEGDAPAETGSESEGGESSDSGDEA